MNDEGRRADCPLQSLEKHDKKLLKNTIKMPCNVGDTLYVIEPARENIPTLTYTTFVDKIELLPDGKISVICGNGWWQFSEKDFGVKFFISPKAADTRMKEVNE